MFINTLIAAAALMALVVLGLGVNIFFRKKEFPQFDVGSNENMRRLGIRCYKDEDAAAQGLTCSGHGSLPECKDCKLYEPGSDSRPS